MELETQDAEGQPDEQSLLGASDEQLESIIRGTPLQESDAEESAESEPDAEEQSTEGEALAEEDDSDNPELPKEFATRDELQELKNLLNKQEKQLNGQELLLQRRASEIADVKQRLQGFIQTSEAKLDELEPREQAKLAAKIEKASEQLAEAEAEEEQIGRVATAHKAVETFVEPNEWDVEAMLVTLKRDWQSKGQPLPPDVEASFRANPYAHGTPEGLVHLAKRSFVEKLLVQSLMALKAEKEKREKLEKSVKPERVIQGVNKALRKAPPLTSSTGGAKTKTGKKAPMNPNPLSWSDEDIESILSENR